jgi:hypothetical protein
MSSLDHACDAMDLVVAAVNAVGLMKNRVCVEDIVDRCASTRGINLSKHVVKVAKQQSRYSVRHEFYPIGVSSPVSNLPIRSNKRSDG